MENVGSGELKRKRDIYHIILIKETWRKPILISGKSDFGTRKIKINKGRHCMTIKVSMLQKMYS